MLLSFINVTARLFFFSVKKGECTGWVGLGGVPWGGLGVIYDLRIMFLCLIPLPLVHVLYFCCCTHFIIASVGFCYSLWSKRKLYIHLPTFSTMALRETEDSLRERKEYSNLIKKYTTSRQKKRT